MTNRERQYIDWNKYWEKRKPVHATYDESTKMYSAAISGSGMVRVPDYILKKNK